MQQALKRRISTELVRTAAVLAALTALLITDAAAQVPLQMPIQGVVRDNAGVPVAEGSFAMIFALYESADAENAVWFEQWPPGGADCSVDPTGCVVVEDGYFSATLGSHTDLPPTIFRLFPELWLGVSIETEAELPRRPLGTSAWAFHAASAASSDSATTASGLSCSGCVDANELSVGTVNFLIDQTVAEMADEGYAKSASTLPYNDVGTGLGATDVQAAIEALNAKVGGGGGNEGAGTVRGYANQWELGPFGEASEYIHLLNPTKPKVLTYIYGDTTSSLATGNNLAVAYAFEPNQYSSGVNGQAGDVVVQVNDPAVFNAGSHIMLYQTVSNSGLAGQWELNAVKSVEGSTVQLVKPLTHTYTDSGGTQRAQAVVAASYNNLEVVSGGNIRPSQELDGSGQKGGIVYLRAQTITVRAGGIIQADNAGFIGNGGQFPGDSECTVEPPNTCHQQANCSGGGGCGQNCNCGGGGGGNKTAGANGGCSCSYGTIHGGQPKGDEEANALTMGGAGGHGHCWHQGRDGGGVVVIGASKLVVEPGGIIRSNGQSSTNWGGAGAGGTVALFVEELENEGTIEAEGGNGPDCGGEGGEGYVHELPPIEGIINESFPKSVEIWVDGTNVTPSVGDPNGKGDPHYDAAAKKWGADGLHAWATGPLDLSNVANWSLGEHEIRLVETGGAGGELKAYFYLIQTFSSSVPPPNNTCANAQIVSLGTTPSSIAGTTEDVMGKTLASDASSEVGCGGFNGPDVVYQLDLAERAILNAEISGSFPAKIYIREGDCEVGELVACADKEITTEPIEAGTYFLWIDSDAAAAKGDFQLSVWMEPAPLPENDTCAEATELVFDDQGLAVVTGTTVYAIDDAKGLCPGAKSGGPDVVFHFTATEDNSISVNLEADFEAVIHLETLACGEGVPLNCSAAGSLFTGLAGGDYWLYVDGLEFGEWGDYTLTAELL